MVTEETELLIESPREISIRSLKQVKSTNGENKTTANQLDSGYGYVIMLIGFLIQFFLMGFLNNIGILLNAWGKEFPNDRTLVALVSTVVYGLTFFMAPVCAFLAEGIGCRLLGFLGNSICIFSLMLSSIMTSPISLLFSFGVLFGIGNSFMYFSSIMVIPSYFNRLRPMANGIITSGSGVGTLVLGTLFTMAFNTFGWRTGLHGYCCVLFFLNFILIFMRPRGSEYCPCSVIINPFNQKRCKEFLTFVSNMKNSMLILTNNSLCSNIQFMIFLISCLVLMLGYIAPFLYASEHAYSISSGGCNFTKFLNSTTSKQASISSANSIDCALAGLLIGFLSISSSISKIATGLICSKFTVDRIKLIQSAFFVMGVMYTLIPFIKIVSWLPPLMIICGVAEGVYVALTVLVVDIVKGSFDLNSAVGILYAMKSIPLTLSGFIIGSLYASYHSLKIVFVTSGMLLILASLILSFLHCLSKPQNTAYKQLEFSTPIEL